MTTNDQPNCILWQENSEEVPEEPIAIKKYAGSRTFELRQRDNVLSLNFDSVPELMKALKALVAE